MERAVLLAVLLVAACAGDADAATTTAAPANTSASGLEGELLVSAAASLTDAFAGIEAAFESVNPGVDVLLNLGCQLGVAGANPGGSAG